MERKNSKNKKQNQTSRKMKKILTGSEQVKQV